MLQVRDFGELVQVGRPGGQGRVLRPQSIPAQLGPGPVLVKLYRQVPGVAAAAVLREMVGWSAGLAPEERARLHQLAAWPVGVVCSRLMPVGIAMEDVSRRFEVPFVMPSGRRERILLALEHLLGPDDYLQLRGLPVKLDTTMRARVAGRVSEALGRLHRHGIAASDIAPSNLLVGFGPDGPTVCFIDCDSMAFHGRQALEPVETRDWNLPAEFAERAGARAGDAYKLALAVLRLFVRSHDARKLEPHARHVPAELRELLVRGLGRDPANRPPAGEWQRALDGLLARGDLDRRYPGPVAPPRRVPRSAPVYGSAAGGGRSVRTPGARAARGAGTPAARTQAAGAARTHAPRPAAGPVWLRPAVAMLWVIAGTAALALLLSRLFAAAVPTQTGGGMPAVYQYYPPQNQIHGPEYYGTGR